MITIIVIMAIMVLILLIETLWLWGAIMDMRQSIDQMRGRYDEMIRMMRGDDPEYPVVTFTFAKLSENKAEQS